jgi:hypothetical protein
MERIVFRIQGQYLALQLVQERMRPCLQGRVAGSARIAMRIADEHVGIEMWFEIRHLLEAALTDEIENAYDQAFSGWPGQSPLCDFPGFLAISWMTHLPMSRAPAVMLVTPCA